MLQRAGGDTAVIGSVTHSGTGFLCKLSKELTNPESADLLAFQPRTFVGAQTGSDLTAFVHCLLQRLLHKGSWIARLLFQKVVSKDPSLNGQGALCNGGSVRGIWTTAQAAHRSLTSSVLSSQAFSSDSEEPEYPSQDGLLYKQAGRGISSSRESTSAPHVLSSS